MHLHTPPCNLLLPLLLLLLTPLPPSKSQSQTFKFLSDPRSFILLHDFGFASPGFISVSVSSASVSNPSRLSSTGCFYAPSPARPALEQALLRRACIASHPLVFPIFTFDDKSKHFNKSLLVTIPDLYFIFLLNCGNTSSISITLNLETYNVKPNGDRDYIDEQFSSLPTTLFIFSFLYLTSLLAWSYYCNKNKQFVRKIHELMALLLFLRLFELLFHAGSLHRMRQAGSPHAWKFFWLMIYFVRNLLFICVIMLIRAGWSLFRPNLQILQIRAILITLALQFVTSSCFVVINGVGPSGAGYRVWTVMYYAVDFVCCVIMTLPVSPSIDKVVVSAKINEKEEKKWVYKRAYESFALALYIYVGFTRLGMFLIRTITSYNVWGLSIALELTIELIFYGVVYSMFWPSERYDYVVLEDREEDHASCAAALSDLRLLEF
ncbi:protein CANDIDATE G-PROTEIN COUPLED RECEPTOR 7-like [Salvia miltiorrhiza]|uniref:protein CANDIDATE G-PROTEIN COUPLED RECEPTOR 7-like n=1 Tax=Salvia miltiorrhiza TaxID=226208 RepID=UPI0025ACBC41|nr:protein CANDIDATE G-PROTEIN COUPLED RECEPTOR 7-like [Salvia miltiorrhiza]